MQNYYVVDNFVYFVFCISGGKSQPRHLSLSINTFIESLYYFNRPIINKLIAH